jgi:hypothetical protein
MRTRVEAKAALEQAEEVRRMLEEMGRGFTDEDLPWLYGVVESLKKYGPAVVAEERVAYGSDGTESEEARVRLP